MLAKKVLLIYLVIFWPKKREIALFLNDIYNSAIIFCDNQQSLHLLCLNDIENLEYNLRVFFLCLLEKN